jgi:hypothetical protein
VKSKTYLPIIIALVISVSGVFMPFLWTPMVLPISLFFILAAVVFIASRYDGPELVVAQPLPIKYEYILIALITLIAFMLRIPNLNSNPPGILVDEAYQGLQGIAHWTGERLPPVSEHETPPDYPFWSLIEAVSTKMLGVSIGSIRFPAAIIGALNIPLLWYVMRSLFGGSVGLVSAMFLCGSFWHVHNSRLAFPLTSLVAESLAVCWLLLSPAMVKRRWSSALAGGVSAYSIFGYSAALFIPIWGFIVSLLSAIFPVNGKRSIFVPATFIFFFIASVALISTFNPVSRQFGRSQSMISSAVNGAMSEKLSVIANFFSTVKTTNGQWANHPRGASRLSSLEILLLVVGIFAFYSNTKTSKAIRYSIILWLICSILPEVVPGEVHLTRGIGELVPLSVIIGFAGWYAITRWGKKGLAFVLVIGLSNAVMTARHVYLLFPNDPQVKSWYQYAETESSVSIREMSSKEPVKSIKQYFSYSTNPTRTFLLWNEIRNGRIILEDNLSISGLQPGNIVFPDPATGDPLLFILTGPKYPKDRRILPVTIFQVLAKGDLLENQGRLDEAEEFYRRMLGMLPQSRYTQMKLNQVLYKKSSLY